MHLKQAVSLMLAAYDLDSATNCIKYIAMSQEILYSSTVNSVAVIGYLSHMYEYSLIVHRIRCLMVCSNLVLIEFEF